MNDAVGAKIEHFTTRRMVAERITPGDREDVRRLPLPPQVMRILPVDDETLPVEAVRKELEHDLAHHWQQHGFGP